MTQEGGAPLARLGWSGARLYHPTAAAAGMYLSTSGVLVAAPLRLLSYSSGAPYVV